ncbi:MAG: hypothetical protein RBS43_02890 [Candidatus Cloacimonas sp.]|jgi:hypothetical protein|nr:hypothetical protein [Candidatus Cloacimonas sp.]
MKTRFILLIALLALSWMLQAQNVSGLDLPLPQFTNPFYDSFSKNYPGINAAGRGNTGVAALGDATTLLLNPAGAVPDSTQLFLELDFKPPIEAYGYSTYARYSAPPPFSLLGVSGKLGSKVSGGLYYNMPKSILLDDFSILINQGNDMVVRLPVYYIYQLTANLGYHSGPWHWGVNVHNQLHYTDDTVFLKTYDRVRDFKYALRIQPGLIYDFGKVNVGLSVMPPTRYDWDLKYKNYDVIQPLWLNAGLSGEHKGFNVSLETEFEQFSAISDDFKDRITLKAGVEKAKGSMVYRAGYLHTSNVFAGLIQLPENTSATADTSIFWNDVPTSFTIKDGSQHIISCGLSHYHRDGSINLAAMHSFSADAPQTQVMISLSLYLSSFHRKSFMYFDD